MVGTTKKITTEQSTDSQEPATLSAPGKINYTTVEKEILRQLVTNHASTIENKKTDAVTSAKKTKAWKLIEAEFNSQGTVNKRSAESLKKCWDNLKTRTKEDYDRFRRGFHGTAGGASIPDVSAQSVLIHEIIASQVDPMVNPYDNDADADGVTGNDGVQGECQSLVIRRESNEPPGHDTNQDYNGSEEDYQQDFQDNEDQNESINVGKRSKRRKCNFAQETLINLEKVEHKQRLANLKEQKKFKKDEHDKKMEILDLKKKYWESRNAD